jgi:hypothetical protein
MWGVEVQLHAFLSSEIGGVQNMRKLYLQQRDPGTQKIGSGENSRVGLDTVVKTKSLEECRMPSSGMAHRVALCHNRRFGGMHILHYQGDKTRRPMDNVSRN